MFYITSKSGKGKGSHYHLVYFDENNQKYLCAEAGTKNATHSHEIVLDEAGQIVILPAGDGHVHEGIEDYPIDLSGDNQPEDTIVKEVLDLYARAVECEQNSFNKAEESERFYKGDQWTESQRNKLKEEGRACLTINKIEKGVDTLIGNYLDQRTDITYLPQEGTDQFTADVFNLVTKHILNKCNYPRHERKVMLDAIVTGRGNFQTFVDFDDSLEGNIKVERAGWRDVKYGQHEEEDLSDCEYTFKEAVFSLAKVKQLWPDKADDISNDFEFYEQGIYKSPDVRYPGRQYSMSENNYSPAGIQVGENLMIDIANKEYRVIECERKVYSKKNFLVNDEYVVYDADGWKQKDLEAAKSLGFIILPRTVTRYRNTKVAGNVLLSDEYPVNKPFKGFDLTPVYAKKIGQDYWGKVESAKDSQREVNKRHSQAIDVVNKASNYNYFIDESTFVNKKERERFKRQANIPGAVFDVIDSNRIPVASQGQRVPSEIIALLEMNSSNVEDQMNVVTEFAGANEPTGRWIQRNKQKNSGNSFLFENLSLAKVEIGRKLIPLIQKYWSPNRIYRLLAAENARQPIEVGEQPFEEYPKERIIEALQNLEAVELDVVVSESEASPSSRVQVFMLLSDLIQSGQVQVPPDVLIEVMPDLPEVQKQKLLDSIYQQQEMMTIESENNYKMEINKSLIGKGILPPEVKAELDAQKQELEQAYVQDASGSFPETM